MVKRVQNCVQLFALAVVFGLLTENALADENKVDEIRLKAAYLVNFARFVYWPATESDVALQVCIIDGDLYRELVPEIKPGSVQQRRVSIIVLSVQDVIPPSCNMIFIAQGHRNDWPRILNAANARTVITVGEEADFIASGGIMRFYYDNGKLRFAADPNRARAAGVQISAKLLDLAKIETSSAY